MQDESSKNSFVSRRFSWVLAMAIAGGVIAVLATTGGVRSSPAAHSYSLEGFTIVDGPQSDQIGVEVRYAWAGPTYPGPADCYLEVSDSSGNRLGRSDFRLDSLTPGDTTPAIPVSVSASAEPSQVSGDCGEGVPPSSRYTFSDIRVVAVDANQAVDGDEIELQAVAHWDGSTSPGTHECTLSAPSDDIPDFTFTLGVGDGSTFDVRVPSEFKGILDPALSCSPYNADSGPTTPSEGGGA
jgi:hypothetical protein